VDVYGYSMGAFVALLVASRASASVRKLVLTSATYTMSGVHPGLMDGLGEMTPEMMHGSTFHDEYLRIAPRPEDFPTLFAKKTEMDQTFHDLGDEDIGALEAPTLVMIGDSDLVRPEHAVEMFRLLGGGVFGDMPPGCPPRNWRCCPARRMCRSRRAPIWWSRSSRSSSTLRCRRSANRDRATAAARTSGGGDCNGKGSNDDGTL